jgi:1-acyl-sn-glycerol-3-phosphate acyltransferase
VNPAGRESRKPSINSDPGGNVPGKSPSTGGLIHRLTCFFLRFIFRTNGGLDVIGGNNVPLEGGVIIASNHISYLDPPLLASVLPRRATFIARKGLFGIPLLGWYIKHYAFPVDREKTNPSTIKEAVKRLKKGNLLAIFPEGRRSDTGELQEGKRGIGMIARLSSAVIVPALIIGSDKALPPGAKWLKRSRITVIFDKPFVPSALYEGSQHVSEGVTREIMGAISAIKKRYGDNSSEESRVLFRR